MSTDNDPCNCEQALRLQRELAAAEARVRELEEHTPMDCARAAYCLALEDGANHLELDHGYIDAANYLRALAKSVKR